ncbi:MAG: ParB/RepB/Spo0J family partition protein [Candidatus Hydrogenedens sp.]|nr:ParB/RepB/Spo0J family partition protein [Candidatus Hydrogenedens sp.]
MAKKSGLGRGLGALLGGNETARGRSTESLNEPAAAPPALPAPEGVRLVMLDPSEIRPNPKQPRTHFDESALEDLCESIKRDGVQEPVIVRERNGGFELVSGERRVRASVMADMTEIPAVVRDIADDDMLRLGLIENLQREDLNPIETAEAYHQLVEQFGWTQEQLAAEVGKKRATVANSLRLLQLTESVRDLVANGELSMGHARALLAVDSATRQLALAKRAVRDGLSVREVEKLAASDKGNRAGVRAEMPRPNPNITALEDELRRVLGTKVRIKAGSGGKGRIEIDYFTLDEFERILELLKP